jgi:ribosomal protein L6P/L9E
MFSTKKYWRFNVGHSHVFLYFSPKNIIVKAKNRFVLIFGYKKNQVFDILEKIRTFHIPDVYKGVGLKYPNEIIRLKKGKTRS